MKRNVTLSDVAREAGVSLMTASRAVNGSADRRRLTSTQQQVALVAERLGYVPDASAQAIARGRTSTLGLILSDTHDSSITTALYDGVVEIAAQGELSVSMMSASGDPAALAARVREMHRLRVRGLVIAAVDGHDPSHVMGLRTAVEAFARSGGLVCTLGFRFEGTSSVTLDEHEGARSLTTLLYSSGYRRPAILAGSSTNATHAERTRGLLDGFAPLRRAGDPAPVVVQPDADKSATVTTAALLSLPEARPDVLVVVSPLDLTEVLDAVHDADASVPTDVAVVAFGDMPATTIREVDLTRVSTPWFEAAQSAAEYAAIELSRSGAARDRVIPTRVVLGSSTTSIAR